MNSEQSHRQRIAVIIGGGGGIGRAIAQDLAVQGYGLALVDHSLTRLEESASLLRTNEPVSLHSCDITQREHVEETMTSIVEKHGCVDFLIHAAGLTQVSLARETTIDVYQRVMDVNFFGVVHITRLLLPSLIRAKGRIVVMSSICGFAPLVGRTGYCASKYALHGYFETLRIEIEAEGVSITMVCPSFVDTDFAKRGLSGDGSPLAFDRSTLGTPLRPDRLARDIIRASLNRRRLLVFTWRGKLTYWLTRLLPTLYGNLMGRAFRMELHRKRL
ncbi:SDR family oxidoreductase [bacterium]|nr:SDR family oxidoreductase [bacterium]